MENIETYTRIRSNPSNDSKIESPSESKQSKIEAKESKYVNKHTRKTAHMSIRSVYFVQ